MFLFKGCICFSPIQIEASPIADELHGLCFYRSTLGQIHTHTQMHARPTTLTNTCTHAQIKSHTHTFPLSHSISSSQMFNKRKRQSRLPSSIFLFNFLLTKNFHCNSNNIENFSGMKHFLISTNLVGWKTLLPSFLVGFLLQKSSGWISMLRFPIWSHFGPVPM